MFGTTRISMVVRGSGIPEAPPVLTLVMLIIVTGASGLIGTPLVSHLESNGHTVRRLVRTSPTGDDRRWDPSAGTLDPADLAGADAVIHLAGAGIGDHRWTPAYKSLIRSSRVAGTELIARTMASMTDGPKVLLSGSAIGIYGNRGDEVLDETSPLGSGFLADVCRDWEAATAPAEAAGIRVAHLRTGIVLTPAGGALKKLLPLFRLGAGGRFGSGRQFQSWISLDDEIGAMVALLTSDVSGPVNLTAPNPVTNRDFTAVLAKVLHRPALFPVPSFGPGLVVGRELADNLLFHSQRVQPRVLEAAGYRFTHPTLDAALTSLLTPRSAASVSPV
jgi:hypothetical protein